MRSARLLAALGLGALALRAIGRAQEGLFVEHRDAYSLVRSAVRSWPYVEDNGKLVPASGTHFGLSKVDEYAPFFISIRHLHVGTSAINLINSGATINKTFEFRAEFESGFALKNVFVVLDLNSADAGRALFLWEVGDLRPRKPQEVTLYLPLNVSLGEGKYKLHLFTDGREVFHSQMPWTYVESTLDRMVAKRVQGASDGNPRPFVGPSPEYPSKLLRAKTSGQATISLVVSRNGRVLDPQVADASDPAFGASALAAARLWRFLPRIVQGQPVETQVSLPFEFSP